MIFPKTAAHFLGSCFRRAYQALNPVALPDMIARCYRRF
jgi:hypothetical protein